VISVEIAQMKKKGGERPSAKNTREIVFFVIFSREKNN